MASPVREYVETPPLPPQSQPQQRQNARKCRGMHSLRTTSTQRCGCKLRVLTQNTRDAGCQCVHKRLAHAEGVPVPHTPSQDAAEDVAPASVRGEHAVAYESNGSARVVSDDLAHALSLRMEHDIAWLADAEIV